MNGFEALPITGVICVIDPDPGVREGISYLCQSAGHAVRGYSTGSAFLRDIEHIVARCIICDEKLPDISGIWLFEEVKRRGLNVPFALLISRNSASARGQASRAGIENIWSKPLVDPEPLQMMLGWSA